MLCCVWLYYERDMRAKLGKGWCALCVVLLCVACSRSHRAFVLGQLAGTLRWDAQIIMMTLVCGGGCRVLPGKQCTNCSCGLLCGCVRYSLAVMVVSHASLNLSLFPAVGSNSSNSTISSSRVRPDRKATQPDQTNERRDAHIARSNPRSPESWPSLRSSAQNGRHTSAGVCSTLC